MLLVLLLLSFKKFDQAFLELFSMSVSNRKLIRLILELPLNVIATDIGQKADWYEKFPEHEPIEINGHMVEPKAIQNAFVF